MRVGLDAGESSVNPLRVVWLFGIAWMRHPSIGTVTVMNVQPHESYDPRKRSAEKQASRKADARAATSPSRASGCVSTSQLPARCTDRWAPLRRSRQPSCGRSWRSCATPAMSGRPSCRRTSRLLLASYFRNRIPGFQWQEPPTSKDIAGPGEEQKRRRSVLKLNQRVFRFCRDDGTAGRVHEQYRIDPFEAVLADDDRLPTLFRRVGFPRWARVLGR